MTFLEVIAVLAVVVLLSAVLLPEAISRLTQGQTATLAADLKNLSAAINSFRSDVGRYPRQLSYLTVPIATGDKDSCDGTIPDPGSWKGPYLGQGFPATGLAAGPATVRSLTVRVPAALTPTGPNGSLTPADRTGVLLLSALEVDRAVADQLEAAFDGNADLSAGTIRWTAGTGGQGRLDYAITIRGC